MEIKIDTNKDSATDIEGAISLLQNILKSRGHSVSMNVSNNYSHSVDDRLARKIAKAKAKSEESSEPVIAPMGMFTNEPQANPESESEPAFNMFESQSDSNMEKSPISNMFDVPAQETNNSSANDLLNENYSSDNKDDSDDEPKVEIIPF